MQVIKSVLLLILFFLVIGAGTYVVRRSLSLAAITQKRDSLAQILPGIQGRFSQAKESAQRVQEAGRVLGVKDENILPRLPFQLDEKFRQLIDREYIASVSGSISVPQSYERVRYEYCQQVVKDFDGRYK